MTKIQKGFTLVEIIIVLGIAATIMTLVLVAAGQAQSNARDTQRRSDASKLATAIEGWASNNNGALPQAADVSDLYDSNYLDSTKFKDPSTATTYVINVGDAPTGTCPIGNMYYSSPSPSKYSTSVCLQGNKVYTYTP